MTPHMRHGLILHIWITIPMFLLTGITETMELSRLLTLQQRLQQLRQGSLLWLSQQIIARSLLPLMSQCLMLPAVVDLYRPMILP